MVDDVTPLVHDLNHTDKGTSQDCLKTFLTEVLATVLCPSRDNTQHAPSDAVPGGQAVTVRAGPDDVSLGRELLPSHTVEVNTGPRRHRLRWCLRWCKWSSKRLSERLPRRLYRKLSRKCSWVRHVLRVDDELESL